MSRSVSRSRVIDASADDILAVIASPAGHEKIDGSGSVRGMISGPDPLEMGSKFRMKMKLGVPYRMALKVVDFEQNRLIAWAHAGKHRWRFELESVDGGTRVTETFDWSTAISPRIIERMGWPDRHPANLELTLERLEAVVLAGP